MLTFHNESFAHIRSERRLAELVADAVSQINSETASSTRTAVDAFTTQARAHVMKERTLSTKMVHDGWLLLNITRSFYTLGARARAVFVCRRVHCSVCH